MRISEFCGLTMKDIDLEKRTININHQLQRTSKMEYVIEPTKTNAGTRVIPMTKEVTEMFRAIIQDRPEYKVEKVVGGYTGFLFLDKNGMPLVAMHWEHRFNSMVGRYNEIYKVQMPNITPHVCRHTYCSNMAKSGMNPKTLQYLMGHSDIAVTLTVYDMLVLSLTKKDLIATFNWDPLLVEAYSRCTKITNNLPQLAFLHGNVAVATCEKDMVLGNPYDYCPKCGKKLSEVPLLYPIREKNYERNPYIASSWEQLSHYLENAYRLTIFGYSAPKSDKAAIDMLKKAWGKVSDRNLEEIEIIDIRPEDEVITSWEEFIHTHHYSVFDNFYDSALGRFPRRTCELLFDNTQGNMWIHGDKGFKKEMNFEEITTLLQALLEDEKTGNDILSDPYVL